VCHPASFPQLWHQGKKDLEKSAQLDAESAGFILETRGIERATPDIECFCYLKLPTFPRPDLLARLAPDHVIGKIDIPGPAEVIPSSVSVSLNKNLLCLS
jgi:hypothetical protein